MGFIWLTLLWGFCYFAETLFGYCRNCVWLLRELCLVIMRFAMVDRLLELHLGLEYPSLGLIVTLVLGCRY
jgi:hypothetical protein